MKESTVDIIINIPSLIILSGVEEFVVWSNRSLKMDILSRPLAQRNWTQSTHNEIMNAFCISLMLTQKAFVRGINGVDARSYPQYISGKNS
ncbi:hypothetical protein [Pseudopedobacter beijingensis]|uniref:Uncharacterized protein n=1 Tax=Pseudopedobacter beijingensis TaxID=1207056 RepID=A0ABW4IBY3_9SPHI